jgi:hypothetical protein
MRHKFFTTMLPLVMYIITSCSKDKPLDTSSNNVSATISIGSNAPFQFSATGATVKFYQDLYGGYDVEAIDANNSEIFIGIGNSTQTTGTYPFSTTPGTFGTGGTFEFIKDVGSASQLVYWTSVTDPSYTNRGSVTITVLNNHHIEGLFNASCRPDFTGGDVAQVSNGSFKINY